MTPVDRVSMVGMLGILAIFWFAPSIKAMIIWFCIQAVAQFVAYKWRIG